MAQNAGSYQLGTNNTLLDLWKARLTAYKKKKCSMSWRGKEVNTKGTAVSLAPCTHHSQSAHAKVKPFKTIDRAHYKVLNKIFPFSSSADKIKTNFDLASLVTCAIRRGYIKEVNHALSLLPAGTFNCIACSRVVHAIGNPTSPKIHKMLADDKACCLSPDEDVAYFKAISTAIRRTSRWPSGDAASLEEVAQTAYWELASGRTRYLSDWAEEYAHRVLQPLYLKPAYWPGVANELSTKVYLEELAPFLDDIMAELIQLNATWTSWEEAVKTRQAWISSGSSGGNKILVEGKEESINKHAYFEEVSDVEMIAWLRKEKARILARASDKMEMGKKRAIYGTGAVDYAIISYLIMHPESKLYQISGVESGLRGVDELRSVYRRMKLMEDNSRLECTMLDYADFNLQHSLPAQSMVFDSMKRRLQEIGAHEDAIFAAEWASEAMLNQYCRFPHLKGSHKVIQGLFSGVRCTNFLNTILNVAYFRHAQKGVKDSLGLEAVELYNIHQGDDVWITNKSRVWAIALYSYMEKVGYIFQPAKQVFDVCRGEFLRVLYTPAGAHGYLARAIASMIIRPIQGSDIIGPAERATSLNSQIMILYRRGLSQECCSIVWEATVPHALELKLPGHAGVNIPKWYAQKDRISGGLDLGSPGTMAEFSTVTTPAMPAMVANTAVMEKAVGKNMSKAWVSSISSEYQQCFKSDKVVDYIHRTNVLDSLRDVDKVKALRDLAKHLKTWRIALGDKITIRRDTDIFNKFVCASTSTSVDPVCDMYLQDMKSGHSFKKLPKLHTMANAIMSAIGTTPFRDLATAKMALGLNSYDTAVMILPMAKDQHAATQAGSALAHIMNNCGQLLVNQVLDGIGGLFPAFEALLNPVCSSWTVQISLEISIKRAVQFGWRTEAQWISGYKETSESMLHTVIFDKTLLSLSKY